MVLTVAETVEAVAVTIREGKAGEWTSSIVAEGSEGDIGVVRELRGEGEDHVPRNLCCAYSDNLPRSRALASWVVEYLLPPSPPLTNGASLTSTVAFDATEPGRLVSTLSSSDSD